MTGGGAGETEGANVVRQVWITRSNAFRAAARVCADSYSLSLIIQAEPTETLDVPLTAPENSELLFNTCRRKKMMPHKKRRVNNGFEQYGKR